jgi:geranylgeranyl pyrophosphate synthase
MSARQQVPLDGISLETFIGEAWPKIECALKKSLPLTRNSIFNAALQSAVFPGGKRFRPTLALLASKLVRADDDDAMAAAVAVEYLHASALIFDDLPGMDNARERRGRPCLHVVYDEGLAVVVALALMNAAYVLVAARMSRVSVAGPAAFRELTDCVAAMIAGQAADLTASSEPWGERSERPWKTSALFRLALTLGPVLSGAQAADVFTLSRFGQVLGEAYQALDDCRDIDEDQASLRRGRGATLVVRHGSAPPARETAADLMAEARRNLLAYFQHHPAAARLCEFARSAVEQAN